MNVKATVALFGPNLIRKKEKWNEKKKKKNKGVSRGIRWKMEISSSM